jgi:hypothetical protein
VAVERPSLVQFLREILEISEERLPIKHRGDEQVSLRKGELEDMYVSASNKLGATPCSARSNEIKTQLQRKGYTELLDDGTMHDMCMLMNTHRAYYTTSLGALFWKQRTLLTIPLSPYFFVPAGSERMVAAVEALLAPVRQLPDVSKPLVLTGRDEIVPGKLSVWSIVLHRISQRIDTLLLMPCIGGFSFSERNHWTLAGVYIHSDGARSEPITVTIKPVAGNSIRSGSMTGVQRNAEYLANLTQEALRSKDHADALLRTVNVQRLPVENVSSALLKQEDGTVCGYAVLAAMLAAVGKPPQSPSRDSDVSSGDNWTVMRMDATNRECALLREAIHVMSLSACRFPAYQQIQPSQALIGAARSMS